MIQTVQAGDPPRNAPQPGLFVYGTLHPDRAPEAMRSVVARLRHAGSGSVQGRLLDLGAYPGLVLDGELRPVRGEVFALPEDAETLPALDAYEGFDPADEAGSLFVRRLCAVTLEGGSEEQHWVYVYNRAVDALGG